MLIKEYKRIRLVISKSLFLFRLGNWTLYLTKKKFGRNYKLTLVLSIFYKPRRKKNDYRVNQI